MGGIDVAEKSGDQAFINFPEVAFHVLRKCVQALERLEGAIRLQVRDWGRGIQPAGVTSGGGRGERVGLSSMRERVALVGGDFEIRSEPGVGTLIAAQIPLPEQDTHRAE